MIIDNGQPLEGSISDDFSSLCEKINEQSDYSIHNFVQPNRFDIFFNQIIKRELKNNEDEIEEIMNKEFRCEENENLNDSFHENEENELYLMKPESNKSKDSDFPDFKKPQKKDNCEIIPNIEAKNDIEIPGQIKDKMEGLNLIEEKENKNLIIDKKEDGIKEPEEKEKKIHKKKKKFKYSLEVEVNKKKKFIIYNVFGPSKHKKIRNEIKEIIKKSINKDCIFEIFKIITTKIRRKAKSDNMRKKIKARFLKALIKRINEILKIAQSKKFFVLLPQCFIRSITKKSNDDSVLNLTFKELMSKDFCEQYKQLDKMKKIKKVELLKKKRSLENQNKQKNVKKNTEYPDKKKISINTNIIKYLEDNKEIYKEANFDVVEKMTFRELFKEYLESKEFEEDILKLKNKDKEDEEYIKDYIILAYNYIEYFSKSG